MNKETISQLKTQAILFATDFGPKVLKLFFFLWVTFKLAGWASDLTKKAMEKAKIDATLSIFAAKMARNVVLLMGILSCLGLFGIQTANFAAVLGAAGFAIGLAFQGTLSNFASGIMLLVFRPFKVGDIVEVSDVTGKVQEIAMFSTIVDTFDNRRFIVPNSEIFGNTIENVTHHPNRRLTVEVGVDYPADIDSTREVLMKALKSVDSILDEPAPQAYLKGLGASSVNWDVRGWAKNEDFWSAKEALTRAVKMELDKAAIGIPYNTVDVNLTGVLNENPLAVTTTSAEAEQPDGDQNSDGDKNKEDSPAKASPAK